MSEEGWRSAGEECRRTRGGQEVSVGGIEGHSQGRRGVSELEEGCVGGLEEDRR